jgi:hypothetical protein
MSPSSRPPDTERPGRPRPAGTGTDGRSIDLGGYIDVAERIRDFRDRYPDGSLQQVHVEFREVAGTWWVIYTAAAYRNPHDRRPGHGTAWEQIPGLTPYTRGSEVQNAETSAWGRAIVATLTADTRRGIASAQEIAAARARDHAAAGQAGAGWVERFDQALTGLAGERGTDPDELRRLILDEATGGRAATLAELDAVDQGPVRAAFRRWKTRTDQAPQTVAADDTDPHSATQSGTGSGER